MVEILLGILTAVVLINIWFTFQIKRAGNSKILEDFKSKFESLEKSITRFEGLLKEEFISNREETNKSARALREELNNAFKLLEGSILSRMGQISTLQKNQLETFTQHLQKITETNNELQKEKFGDLLNKQSELTNITEQKLERLRDTLESSIKAMQEDNSNKLEKMRETVDEKLHKTLEERLGESFNLVSQRLEQVHKGLGEMQALATGVGDLKRVLSNVKTRGIFGEIQLEKILEQLLTVEQYDKNVATKKGSKDVVEFAVKLPGKDDTGDVIYLPIDSKFPLDCYNNLNDAYETGEQVKIELAIKNLEANIKKSAKDIRDKYIDPPNTTDFAIMFLPIEGLYAEVLRRTSLVESLQREFKINVTGPTTLAALLNSLQMGFKTLAIEKRSSEVWKVLGAVKTEFEKFGGVLSKTQDKLNQASNELETLVGKRTKQIQRKLNSIQKLSVHEAEIYLPDTGVDQELED
jgi:DNA recombination protein RmuC